jgi:DNA polymerase (family 10)
MYDHIRLEHTRVTLEHAQPALKRLTIAGDFRCGRELAGDLAIVAEAPGVQR